MTDTGSDPKPRSVAPLPVIINRVVRTYLQSKAFEKSGLDPDKLRKEKGEIDYKVLPADFNVAKQKLAETLFLEFRSRKDQSFVDHFAATFFSVTQRLSEADRLELARILTDVQDVNNRDNLKTLTLLSLSANS